MNVEALEAVRKALIQALDVIDTVLASSKVSGKGPAHTTPKSAHIIRLPEVKQRTGMSRSFIYSGIKNGTFPAPVSLGARAIGWNPLEVDQWIQAKLKNG